jgi:hypothetical protein
VWAILFVVSNCGIWGAAFRYAGKIMRKDATDKARL